MNVKKSLALAASLVLAVACSSNDKNNGDGGGTDASAKDGSLDAKVDAKDVGLPDTQSNSCPTPADVTGFTPGTMTPPHGAQKVCQSGDYAAYFTACLDEQTATTQTCQNWSAAHQTCADCIASNANDAQWGAVVFGTGIVSVNAAGCLELVGATACSKATSAIDQCIGAACDLQCPVTDTASFTLYEQCVKTADAGGCKTYSTAADAACDVDANAAIAKCSGADFQAMFLNVGPVFCGP